MSFFFCCDRSKKNLSHMRASHLAITQSFAFPIEFKELVRGLGPWPTIFIYDCISVSLPSEHNAEISNVESILCND